MSGQNQDFFRIGRGLDADGRVDGWGPDWLGVPYWFSWTNQVSGAAVARVDGVLRLVVLTVDAPVGQNAGLYGWYMPFLVDNDGVPSVAH